MWFLMGSINYSKDRSLLYGPNKKLPSFIVWFCNQRQKQKRMKFTDQSSSSSNEGHLNNTHSPSDKSSEDRERERETSPLITNPEIIPNQENDENFLEISDDNESSKLKEGKNSEKDNKDSKTASTVRILDIPEAALQMSTSVVSHMSYNNTSNLNQLDTLASNFVVDYAQNNFYNSELLSQSDDEFNIGFGLFIDCLCFGTVIPMLPEL